MAKHPRDGARFRPTTHGGWIEQPINADWIAAHRVTVQHGRPVIGEIRIFPREGRQTPHGRLESRPDPGEWSGTDASVPLGGVTSRVLRGVRMGDHGDVLRDYFDAHERERGQPRRSLPSPYREMAETAVPVGRRGRPPVWTDTDYAVLAGEYVEKLQSGCRTPVKLVAELRGLKEGQVRSAIFRARELGLLTRDGVHQGRLGGQLTPRAKAKIALRVGNTTRRTPRRRKARR